MISTVLGETASQVPLESYSIRVLGGMNLYSRPGREAFGGTSQAFAHQPCCKGRLNMIRWRLLSLRQRSKLTGRAPRMVNTGVVAALRRTSVQVVEVMVAACP